MNPYEVRSGTPAVLGIADLAQLIQKTPGTVLADRVRAPHRLPPACTPPGSRQPLWVLEDVIAWLREHREPAAQAPATPAEPRRRGRPTKAKQIQCKRAERARGDAQ